VSVQKKNDVLLLAVLAWLTLPRGDVTEVPATRAEEPERALGPAVPPVQLESGTEN
jgi:hypothetical protein